MRGLRQNQTRRAAFDRATRLHDNDMGAHQTLDPAQGSPFDTVTPAASFEAVAVPGIIDDVMRRARHGTRLIVFGVCMQPDTMNPFFAIAKELNVQFVLP